MLHPLFESIAQQIQGEVHKSRIWIVTYVQRLNNEEQTKLANGIVMGEIDSTFPDAEVLLRHAETVFGIKLHLVHKG